MALPARDRLTQYLRLTECHQKGHEKGEDMNLRKKIRTVLCAVLIGLSFLSALGRGQHAAGPETVLASVNGAGTGSGNGFSAFPAISADGRFVAFESDASDLVANDTNGNVEDVFVRDLKTGTTALVSVNGAGTGSGNGASGFPVISADGRFVAFESDASDLAATDTNVHVADVFVRDLKTGTTTVGSVNSGATGGGNNSA